METDGNPIGRRPHSNPKIYLTRPLGSKDKRYKKNLGKAAWKTTFAAKNLTEMFQSRPILATTRDFRVETPPTAAPENISHPFSPQPPFPRL
jgi:hypothetical protein